jgi:hypothetical protein
VSNGTSRHAELFLLSQHCTQTPYKRQFDEQQWFERGDLCRAGGKSRDCHHQVRDRLVDGFAQQDVSASLAEFGDALRAAGDHLAGSDQRAASQFMMQAANGIERFAGSLKNKPFADVIDDEVRTFGRENSGALIAGSLLAGLALGRFVKSSMPAPGAQRQPQQRTGPLRQLHEPVERDRPRTSRNNNMASGGNCGFCSN